ncbi:hypothetical protein [Pseudomonas izuensis]|uniref:Lipoprotein n=1 Tax=Pseudomonas izuensis TaxID=2684212 RepID=A0ABM7RSG7_9PSED|nr:hypothetical protein [Pseudomonas izuensis]BCX68059.1 hypothetical protein LAB08_R26990 [Pseudomonas izuensis]
MRFLTMFSVATLFVIGLLAGCSVFNTAGAASLRLAENSDGGGKSCSITLPEPNEAALPDDPEYPDHKYHKWDLDYMPGCDYDVYSYFSLDNAPSAAIFEFHSDEGCKREGSTHNEWWYGVQTYKQPTTTGWISIPTLNAHKVGDIVKAGVKMVRHHYDFGDIKAELECVRYYVSKRP